MEAPVFARSFSYLGGFLRAVRRAPGAPAMTIPESGRIWTYRDVDDETDRLAAALAADGVTRGDRVVFQLPNVPEFAFFYLAAKKLGAIAAPINFRLASGEIAYILDRATPAVYAYDAEYAEVAERALAAASHRPRRVLNTGEYGAYVAALPFDKLRAGSAQGDGDIETGAFDETTRLFTSGTTGMPKGVPMTNLNEVMTAHDVIMHLSLVPGDAILNMTPWFHRGGVHIGPTPAFYLGAQVLPLRAFDAAAVLDHVERYRVTYLIGAPPNLRMLAEAQAARRRDLSSLRGIVTMGAPLEREACIRYQRELCPAIYNGYGTTEAFWNTLLRPADLPAHAGTAGRACIDDEVRVVKIFEDRFAAPDELAARDGAEIGEVIVRSPGKCAYRYADDPEREARVFRDGWLSIGDLATWDAEEYVTIVGRKDDMLISGGENVHPVQVEEVLCEHPLVVDALVTGAPDPQWGELVVAYVVARDPALNAAELERHCIEHPMLARYKRPRAYRFVEGLPLTATGKKRHYVAKERAREDLASGAFERA